MTGRLSAAQVAALRHLAESDGCGAVGYAPLQVRTVLALRRRGLTEQDRIDEHPDQRAYHFGRVRHSFTRRVEIERITPAGIDALAQAL